MESYDEIEIYCRRLGHYLSFKYCRTVNNGMPCFKINDCTFEKIPINEFLEKHYTEEELITALKPPDNKITSLIDLINKARENN